jgi:hypothetical protein
MLGPSWWKRTSVATASVGAMLAMSSCSRNVESLFSDTGGSQGGAGGGGTTTSGNGGDGAAVGSGGAVSSTGGSSSTGSPCAASPDEDLDNDGYSIAAGDCNDCDPFVSPAAAELVDPMNPGDPDVP